MSIYERLLDRATAPEIAPSSTSYYSEATENLDPFLFDGTHMRPHVRQTVLSFVLQAFKKHWRNPETWSTTWIAGSGVSFQWSAAREPGDLDVLVGVDWITFRRANPDYADLGNEELAGLMNSNFRQALAAAPPFEHYDTTVYVNAGGTSIVDINPYAAYDVTNDSWTVEPNPTPEQGWSEKADADTRLAMEITSAYHKALDETAGVANPGLRLNASVTLRTSAEHAVRLFDEIHEGRHQAFAPGGLGYSDPANARWQSFKASGAYTALKQIKDDVAAVTGEEQTTLYGQELPSARDTLIASAISRRYKS